MPLHVNDAGVWRALQAVWINDAGTWRRIQAVWINDAGTWRQVFVGDQISIVDASVSRVQPNPAGSATAGYSLTSAGDINHIATSTTDAGDWITPKINMTAYEARATLTSGTLNAGTAGAWQSLSATRTWSITNSSAGTSRTTTFTLEIRRSSDAVVLDTATITLTAEVEPD